MIRYRTGDILAEDAEALVNTVNCVGVMGCGIALQFKKAFPENFIEYASACERREVQPGRLFVFETGQLTNPRYIINFPTKRHWRGKSRIEDIESGLRALAELIRQRGIRSIAVPPLGSGLGGLNWFEVRPRIEEALRGVNDLDVVVFEPDGALATESMVRSREIPRMTSGRAAMVELMNRYLNGPEADTGIAHLVRCDCVVLTRTCEEVVKSHVFLLRRPLVHHRRIVLGHRFHRPGRCGSCTNPLRPGTRGARFRHPVLGEHLRILHSQESPRDLPVGSARHRKMGVPGPSYRRDRTGTSGPEKHPREGRFERLAPCRAASRNWVERLRAREQAGVTICLSYLR